MKWGEREKKIALHKLNKHFECNFVASPFKTSDSILQLVSPVSLCVCVSLSAEKKNIYVTFVRIGYCYALPSRYLNANKSYNSGEAKE